MIMEERIQNGDEYLQTIVKLIRDMSCSVVG